MRALRPLLFLLAIPVAAQETRDPGVTVCESCTARHRAMQTLREARIPERSGTSRAATTPEQETRRGCEGAKGAPPCQPPGTVKPR